MSASALVMEEGMSAGDTEVMTVGWQVVLGQAAQISVVFTVMGGTRIFCPRTEMVVISQTRGASVGHPV